MLRERARQQPTDTAAIASAARNEACASPPGPAHLGLIRPHYLVLCALGVAIWAGLALAFIWTIDPYGVAPLHVRITGLNAFKPKRVDIDRLVKPYEVWRYQPRTVFLGTSR